MVRVSEFEVPRVCSSAFMRLLVRSFAFALCVYPWRRLKAELQTRGSEWHLVTHRSKRDDHARSLNLNPNLNPNRAARSFLRTMAGCCSVLKLVSP